MSTDLELRNRFLGVWSTIKGDLWNPEDPGHFLPSHLSEADKLVARNELWAIPECF